MTPGQLAAVLARLSVAECLTSALQLQAESLKNSVQAGLNTLPGDSHNQPWRRTGQLQESISVIVDGLTARVASNDAAAAAQEFGTARDPPRPFLGPAATALTEPIANEIARAVMKLISGHTD